jgi:cytidylate kinase
MAGMNVDEQTALKTVERTEGERLDWYKRFYETGWLTPWTYDLCINTDHLNPEQAAEVVLDFARLR